MTYPSGGGAAINGVNEVFAVIGAERVGAHHALGDRHGITDRASGVEVAGFGAGQISRGDITPVADRYGAVEEPWADTDVFLSSLTAKLVWVLVQPAPAAVTDAGRSRGQHRPNSALKWPSRNQYAKQ